MIFVLIVVLLLSAPVASIIWFLTNLLDYRLTAVSDAEKRKRCKAKTIVSGIVAGVITGTLVFLVITFMIGIQYM